MSKKISRILNAEFLQDEPGEVQDPGSGTKIVSWRGFEFESDEAQRFHTGTRVIFEVINGKAVNLEEV